MNTKRLHGLVVFCMLASFSASSLAEDKDANAANDLLGVWQVTSSTNSFIFHILPEGKALLILIQDGAHGTGLVTWKPEPGGLMIEGLPRFRFWKGRHRMEARVIMEPLDPALTSSDIQRFPLNFMVRRVEGPRNMPKEVTQRPLPVGWEVETLPEEWDKSAGKRREFNEN